MFPNSIIKMVGDKPGKTLAIFAGIHGNEKAGVIALQELIRTVEIVEGTVYFIFANPPAIEKEVRFVNANLNRLFTRDIQGTEYEIARAHELMDVLDGCDALLDLHSYNSEIGEPFAIAEPNAENITKKFAVNIVTEGFGNLGYGTDDYMFRNGKVGICLECGTSNKYQEFVPFAINSAKQFLKHYGSVSEDIASDVFEQRRVRVKRLLYKQTEDFRFSRDFLDFELLPNDEPFLFNGAESMTAHPQELIMFPRPNVPVGGEVGIIGEFLK